MGLPLSLDEQQFLLSANISEGFKKKGATDKVRFIKKNSEVSRQESEEIRIGRNNQ